MHPLDWKKTFIISENADRIDYLYGEWEGGEGERGRGGEGRGGEGGGSEGVLKRRIESKTG